MTVVACRGLRSNIREVEVIEDYVSRLPTLVRFKVRCQKEPQEVKILKIPRPLPGVQGGQNTFSEQRFQGRWRSFSDQEFENRSVVRQTLWQAHLKSPKAALEEALSNIERQWRSLPQQARAKREHTFSLICVQFFTVCCDVGLCTGIMSDTSKL